MRVVMGIFFALAAAAVHGEDIAAVLERSHHTRLEALPLADAQGERTRTVRASFEAVLAASKLQQPVELRVVTGATLAEALRGRVIVANERLADFQENERRFILAHEIAHLKLGHWPQLVQIYQRWIPGQVRQEQTDAIAGPMGREASEQAHRHEFEADVHALRVLQSLGGSLQDANTAFMRLGAHLGNATHPPTRHRMSALRAAAQADALRHAAPGTQVAQPAGTSVARP